MRYALLMLSLSAHVATALKLPALKPDAPALKLTALKPVGAEASLLRTCAAGWSAVGISAFSGPSARSIVSDCFGLQATTFEDNIREPAAGLLELFAPLLPLEGFLLLALANSMTLSAEDRSRIGGSITLTSFGVLGTMALALGAGMPIESTGTVATVASLAALSGALGVKAARVVDDPLGLYQQDAQALTAVRATAVR